MLFFNYVGFELPNAAGDEMKDPQKDVPFARAARRPAAPSLLYGIPILAILLVLPAVAGPSLGGFIDAMKTVFTVYGGHRHDGRGRHRDRDAHGRRQFLGDLAAIGFILALLSSGRRGSWVPTARRPSPASTALRRARSAASPPASARRSPSTCCPGVFSTIVMVLAFQLTR